MNIDDCAVHVMGTVDIEVIRKGVVIERISEHNLVVNLGRARLAALIAGKSTNYINRIGVGTGTAVAKPTDSALTNQQLYTVTATVSGQDAIFKWTLGTGDANGLNISEFGLFAADDNMMTHFVRGKVIGKDADTVINGTYTLHF